MWGFPGEKLEMFVKMRPLPNSKELYGDFCEKVYVPIYSKPWWMDAVCGPDNWDVWLYEESGKIAAAMPYYLEKRKYGLYITKAPLTQVNGIFFRYPEGSSEITKAKFEERVIDHAMEFVASLGLAVYEQQFHWSFHNWLPFRWSGCVAEPRYTYVIEDTSSIESMWASMDKKCRKLVKKGQKNGTLDLSIGFDEFWVEHAKVFAKQSLDVPFSRELLERLYLACLQRNCGQLFCERLKNGDVASLVFEVWDERSMYSLVGGSVPKYQNLETYHAVRWEAMKMAHEKGLMFDFEGSVIKRISRSVREYGGSPKLYFRIRKIFSEEVVRMEAEQKIAQMGNA